MGFELSITKAIFSFFSQFQLTIDVTKFLTDVLPALIIAFFILYCIWQRRYVLIGLFLGSWIIGFLLKQFITLFYLRLRPYELIHTNVKVNITENSFYSMHTFIAFLGAFFIFFLTKNKTIRVIAIVLAILTAFSRLVLAQHFLSDILAWFLIALILYLISKKVYEKWFVEKVE